MRKLFIPLALFLTTCSAPDNKHKANGLISEYVKKLANDPGSYEPVSFGRPRAVIVGELLGVEITSSSGSSLRDSMPGQALIKHIYRGKNKFGALSLESEDFVVDSISGKVQLFSEAQEEIAKDARKDFEEADREAKRLEDSADIANSRMR